MKHPATDITLLQAWAKSRDPAHLKWAQRAWCVLAAELDSRALASMGLSEERVLVLRDAYAQMGLVGLADAPRAGRPRRHAPGAGVIAGAADGSSGQAHARWRDARRSGQALARQRSAVAVLDARRWEVAAPFALWVGAGLRMAAWQRKDGRAVWPGLWFHPAPAARAEAARAGAPAGGSSLLLGLPAAMAAHGAHAAPATARGERDKLAFWTASVSAAAEAGTGPVRLAVHVDDALGALPVLLAALRRQRLWHGPGGVLAGLVWQPRAAWLEALSPLRAPLRSLAGAAGQAALAWAPPVKAQSAPDPDGLLRWRGAPAPRSG